MRKYLILILLIPLFAMCTNKTEIVSDGDRYSIQTPELYIEIDASAGARITSFKTGDHEFLYPVYEPDNNLVGSTLWPSPQSVWNWPPPAELDNLPYKAAIEEKSIVMTSEKDPVSGLVFRKKFTAGTDGKCIVIDYEIINKGDSVYSVAAWAVTRVPSAGSLSFFPSGDGPVTGTNGFEKTTEVRDGITWYQQKPSDPTTEKFFSDGKKGWFAHVNKSGYLFVKTFEDVPSDKAAPGEAEIELYYRDQDSYIELENQSAYVTLDPGASFSYKVSWYAGKLPGNPEIKAGNPELVSLAEELID